VQPPPKVHQTSFDFAFRNTRIEGIPSEHLQLVGERMNPGLRHRRSWIPVMFRCGRRQRRQRGPRLLDPVAMLPGRHVPNAQSPEQPETLQIQPVNG